MSQSKAGRRLIFPAQNQVRCEEFALPGAVEPGEVLIAARRTLISTGTETASLRGKTARSQQPGGFPHAPGYSFAGVVQAVGKGVEEYAPGDPVYCQARHASHVTLPAKTPTLIKIPAGVPFDLAPFATLYAVALYGVRKGAVAFGESVLILGAGLVGQLALRLARMTPAVPLAIADLKSERLGNATAHGADVAEVLDESGGARLKAATYGGEGFDVVIDATGASAALPQALDLVRKRGRVVLLGSPHGPVTIDDLFVQVDAKDAVLLGAHQPNNPLTASLSHPWSQRRDRELILDLFAKSKLDASGVPFHRTTPDEAPEIYSRLGIPGEESLTALISWD